MESLSFNGGIPWEFPFEDLLLPNCDIGLDMFLLKGCAIGFFAFAVIYFTQNFILIRPVLTDHAIRR